jgi:hypothetical protein
MKIYDDSNRVNKTNVRNLFINRCSNLPFCQNVMSRYSSKSAIIVDILLLLNTFERFQTI